MHATADSDAHPNEVPDAEASWIAVLTRDARKDGAFVYGVRTTGIYCRPSCPARRPRRENVVFHASPATAEAAGLRECRRCRPKTEPSTPDAVARALAYLDARIDERGDAPAVSLHQLAAVAGTSASHLQRTFKRALGVSPKQYTAAHQAERLKTELRRGTTVSRATFEAGYSGGSRAYAAAETHLGMTPAAYRKGGVGVTIRFATATTAHGRLLVAATDRGVCSVTLAEDDAQLELGLADEFPRATRVRVSDADLATDTSLHAWLNAVVAHLAGTRPALGLPTDVHGTPLQRRVWQELQRIPYGETRSYAAVAAAVGVPRAVRAVATACARNRVALVVPCHRVVRGNGELGGYRWGPERKRRLLALEHAVVARRLSAL